MNVLIGIPGCGKSTFASTHLSHTRIVSSDEIRKNFGDVNDQSQNKLVFDLLHAMIDNGLGSDHDVTVDATNLNGRHRQQLYRIAADKSASVHLFFFKNVRQGIEWNASRDRVVPTHAMTRMLRNYELARIQLLQEREQYDTLTEIDRLS